MPTPEEARKELERLSKLTKEERLRIYQANARTALDDVFKTQNLSDEEKQAARDRLDIRLKQIYDPRAITAVTDAEAKDAVRKIVDSVLPANDDPEKVGERTALIAKSEAAVDKVFGKRDDLVEKVSTVLDGVSKLSPEFETVKDAKKLQVMAGLQAQIPEILSREFKDEAPPGKSADDQKKAALEEAIKETLLAATGGKNKAKADATAKEMATSIFNRDQAMRTELTTFMKDNKIGSDTEKKTTTEKTASDELDKLAADVATKAVDGMPVDAALGILDPQRETLKASVKDAVATVLKDDKVKLEELKTKISSAVAETISMSAPATATVPESLFDEANVLAEEAAKQTALIKATRNSEVKRLDDAEKKARDTVMTGAVSSVWPEMLRSNVPADKKVQFVTSAVADAVRGEGTLSADQVTKIKALSVKLTQAQQDDGFKQENGAISANHAALIDNVRGAAGSKGAFSNVKVGLVTAGAVGGAALVGLGTEMSTWKKVTLGAAAIGGALAWENGAFDKIGDMFKPNGTPEGDKNKRQIT